MRKALAAVLVGALAFAAVALAGVLRPARAVATGTTTGAFCGEQRLFGFVRGLTKTGATYRLLFDPAFFLSGVTANRAAAQDGAVPPGQPVPNDNYVVDESRRTYVYRVTSATKVRVIVQGGNITAGTPVTVATLAQLVQGKHPVKLFEKLDTGFWLGVHVDRACSITQQYHP
jgi:hypothetical protein